MLKLVSVIRRKPGMDVDAFQTYWRATHGPIVCRLPGLRRYIQSPTLRSGYARRQPAADGIAELWFDDSAALRALQGSPQLAAVQADETEVIDPHSHQQLFIDEHVIKDGAIPPDGVKNVEFVTRKSGMAVETFQRYWREVHGPLGAAIPTVLRYVQNHARMSSYADGRSPALDGLALTWFENTQAMRESAASAEYAVTRADEKNFLSVPLEFIICREHILLE